MEPRIAAIHDPELAQTPERSLGVIVADERIQQAELCETGERALDAVQQAELENPQEFSRRDVDHSGLSHTEEPAESFVAPDADDVQATELSQAEELVARDVDAAELKSAAKATGDSRARPRVGT